MTKKIKPAYGYMDEVGDALTTSYADNSIELQTPSTHVKIINTGATEIQVLFNDDPSSPSTATKVDMRVRPGQEVDLDRLTVNRISLKSAVATAYQLWAYSQL